MKRVLLTRPLPYSITLAHKLTGFGVDVCPILSPFPTLSSVNIGHKTLVFTSINAAKACHGRIKGDDRLVFCVGAATADAVQELGFSNLCVGTGGGADLARLIDQKGVRSDDLLHLCGQVIRYDFGGARQVVYQMVAIASLPPVVVDRLTHQPYDAILFYSRETARCFADLALAYGFHSTLALCLGPSVAEPLVDLGFSGYSWPDAPTTALMVAKLREMVG